LRLGHSSLYSVNDWPVRQPIFEHLSFWRITLDLKAALVNWTGEMQWAVHFVVWRLDFQPRC
jgi:hypothetical protein